MADERDPQVSKRYRDLGAEEPPRALDDAILAASRRAVESRPAPLVVPTGRRRWYFPVAAAAVITLSVAVTLQVERQKPADELFVASAPPAQKEEAPAPAVEARKAAPKPSSPPRGDAAPSLSPQAFPESLAKRTEPASQPPPADAVRDRAARESATAGTRGPAAQAAETRRMEAELQVKPAPSAAARAAAPNAVLSYGRVSQDPERWLEQVAELRKQGKDEEADKLLAEFRKAYPDYSFTDEMRAKVERKK